MSSNMRILMQKLFWFVGYIILIAAGLNIGLQIQSIFKNSYEISSELNYYYFSIARLFFSAISQSFILFLASSIFESLFLNQNLNHQKNNLFIIIASIGLIGVGVFDLIAWAQSVIYTLPQVDLVNGKGLLNLLGSLMRIFSSLTSFLYTVIIVVFYRHFSRVDSTGY